MGDWIEDNLGVLLILMFIALITGVTWAVYSDAHDPHIQLNKTEWHCSHSHTVMQVVATGKTTVIIPEDVCDTYRMNGYE